MNARQEAPSARSIDEAGAASSMDDADRANGEGDAGWTNDGLAPGERTSGITDDPSDNTTLVEVVDGYREAGYRSDFWAEPNGHVRCGTCGAVFEAARLAARSMRRLEGASDPADMTLVAAAACPICGATGTLVVAFGAMASEDDQRVLGSLGDDRDETSLPHAAAPDEMPDRSTGSTVTAPQ